jgi:hypothetical protein
LDTTVDRDALLATLGEMNTAARAAQIDAARHAAPGHPLMANREAAEQARNAHGQAVLGALPDWIAALTEAVGYRTWTIVYRHRDADRSSIDAIVGPDLHYALLTRALARHPDWTGIPDDQAVARLLTEDWPGAVAIPGEHTAFIFGGDDDE